MKATARGLIAAITICSWLTISNHCVISAVIAKAGRTQSGCPFHSKPAKPQTPAGTECCKILRALANAPAKEPTSSVVNLPDVEFFELQVSAPPEIFFTPATLDTGPPGKTFFAGLNRSLRAHAPPFLV